MRRGPHEGDFGRPSNDAISSSRFSKPLFCGAGAGASLRDGRAGGGSGATGGAIGSLVGRRKAASSRCAISARFWSALDCGGGAGGGGGGGAAARSGARTGGGAFGGSAPRRGRGLMGSGPGIRGGPRAGPRFRRVPRGPPH